MLTNTKALFISILKTLNADGVCDVGSREGNQSLLFRHLLPTAAVIAFEANPINFDEMKANHRLTAERIDLFPYAISDRRGVAHFHVADVDYTDPEANRGISSLLVMPGQPVKSTVEVETQRIDDFIVKHYGGLKRIGLWIDVEGAEHSVLQGIVAIKDRIVAIHVETANEPLRDGQKPLREIETLMLGYGFRLCGRNFGLEKTQWGDVVFVQERVVREMGSRFSLCKFKAFTSYLLRADHIAVVLKRRFPWLYRFLRGLYIRFAT